MKVAVVSIHTPNLQSLADLTWQNKTEYCQRHGYTPELRIKESYQGFDKILFLDELTAKDYDLILWSDADSICTNFNIRIENIAAQHPNHHFFLSTDVNGINGGVFLFRNTVGGRAYLRNLKKKMYELQSLNQFLNGEEQNAMIHTHAAPEWKNIVKLVPQKTFNSYDYDYYNYGRDISLDKLGTQGHWSSGDFAIHFPGLSSNGLENQRLKAVEKYLELVVK